MLFCDYNNLIVTELWNGTLYDLVTVNKDSSIKLSSHQLRDVVLCQIVDGVEYLHHYNIIHRDLKPHNILYRTEPTLMMKVADFGCSRSVTGDATHYTRTEVINGYSKHFRLFGTDGWLAPEVLTGVTQLKPPIDSYPLGLIFAFTLCGGRHPHGDENAEKRDDRIKKNEPILEDIKQQLIKEYGIRCFDLINRMLDPNPEERPTAVQVIADDFFPPRPDIKDTVKVYMMMITLHNDDMMDHYTIISEMEKLFCFYIIHLAINISHRWPITTRHKK